MYESLSLFSYFSMTISQIVPEEAKLQWNSGSPRTICLCWRSQRNLSATESRGRRRENSPTLGPFFSSYSLTSSFPSMTGGKKKNLKKDANVPILVLRGMLALTLYSPLPHPCSPRETFVWFCLPFPCFGKAASFQPLLPQILFVRWRFLVLVSLSFLTFLLQNLLLDKDFFLPSVQQEEWFLLFRISNNCCSPVLQLHT